MLTDGELCQWLTSGDDALKNAISLEGRALFLLVLLDGAVERTPVTEEDAALIQLFRQDAVYLLSGNAISVDNFENYILNDESKGFLMNSLVKSKMEFFWRFVNSVCAWFGGIAAGLQRDENSYLIDVEDPDSINRIFFKWKEKKAPFLPQDYVIKALRFVMKRFPASGEDKLNLDYEHEKALFLAEA